MSAATSHWAPYAVGSRRGAGNGKARMLPDPACTSDGPRASCPRMRRIVHEKGAAAQMVPLPQSPAVADTESGFVLATGWRAVVLPARLREECADALACLERSLAALQAMTYSLAVAQAQSHRQSQQGCRVPA